MHTCMHVIVQHRGQSASEIRDGLQVLLSHTKEVHDNCPFGEGSWCYFQKKVALSDSDSGNAPPTTHRRRIRGGERAPPPHIFNLGRRFVGPPPPTFWIYGTQFCGHYNLVRIRILWSCGYIIFKLEYLIIRET